MSKKFLYTLLLGSSIVLMCSASQEVRALANPASVFCIEKGGSSVTEHRKGAYGVFHFPDGKQCEEWAMIWGYCPVGGIDTADLTPEEGSCLIEGGILLDNATQCQLFTGKICNLKDFYSGKCHRGES